MGWAEEKAREIRASMPITFFGNTDREVTRAMEQAIRETIVECAEVAEADGLTGIRIGAAIRKLGEP